MKYLLLLLLTLTNLQAKDVKSFDFASTLTINHWLDAQQEVYIDLVYEKTREIREKYNPTAVKDIFNLAFTYRKSPQEQQKLYDKLMAPFIAKIHKTIYIKVKSNTLKDFDEYKENSSNFETKRMSGVKKLDENISFTKMNIALYELFANKLARKDIDVKRHNFLKFLYFKTKHLSVAEINEYNRSFKINKLDAFFRDIKSSYLAYLQKLVVSLNSL